MHVTYTDVLNGLLHSLTSTYYSNSHGLPITEKFKQLKAIFKLLIKDRDGVGLLTLKCTKLDHIFEYLLSFGDLRLFDTPPFEQFMYGNKTFIRMASMRKRSSMEESVKEKNDVINNETKNRKNN